MRVLRPRILYSRSPELLNDGANNYLLGFDALRELELDECSGKIVFPVASLEVNIAFQIIGEESQAKFVSDQADGVIKIILVTCCKEVTCH